MIIWQLCRRRFHDLKLEVALDIEHALPAKPRGESTGVVGLHGCIEELMELPELLQV
jgi:hypothetical protein